MSDNINEEVLNRLEAEATVADADAEELTIAVESDIEEKENQVEELQQKVEERESEVEELREEVDEKENQVEEMSEKIDEVIDSYAEELAAHSEFMSEEDFKEKFEFEELQQKVEDMEEETRPAPNGGDPGAGFQSGAQEGASEGGDVELSEEEELAASSFKERARKRGKGYWAEIAEDIENGGE